MRQQHSPKTRLDEHIRRTKEEIKWWVRPGWASIFFWSLVFGGLIALAAYAAGAQSFIYVGIIAAVGFFFFSVLMRDGKGF